MAAQEFKVLAKWAALEFQILAMLAALEFQVSEAPVLQAVLSPEGGELLNASCGH